MFHYFEKDISDIKLPLKFTYPFCYEPHPLAVMASEQVQAYLRLREDWADEIGHGKMFGVLVVEKHGKVGFLAAYSGNIAHGNKHKYFVPPIYDLLSPDSYFSDEEANISEINRAIGMLQSSSQYADLKRTVSELSNEADIVLLEWAERMRLSKIRRDEMRAAGLTEDEERRLIKESQYEKAERRRIKERYADRIRIINTEIGDIEERISMLKEERRSRSAKLQRRLFDSYRLLNAKGEVSSAYEIFNEVRHELPPAGTGECAAPKLLQYAYTNGMHPLCMAEFWWGQSPKAEVRHHLHYYPSCKSKCEPLLGFMLEGLDVEPSPLGVTAFSENDLRTVYEDDCIWVVDKPAGMLSVPGKDGRISVYDIALRRFPSADGPLIVHRLDMDTSGLLVIAKSKDVHENLQRQFAEHKICKRYVALLDGVLTEAGGKIVLPLCLDPAHRPQQMVDSIHGKYAETRFEVIGIEDGALTRVAFYPLTGRTHQLRVHSAHPDGLGMPIHGDRLYGKPSDRLYLHAEQITFIHPYLKKEVTFTAKVPF